jgi:hypothetical protein
VTDELFRCDKIARIVIRLQCNNHSYKYFVFFDILVSEKSQKNVFGGRGFVPNLFDILLPAMEDTHINVTNTTLTTTNQNFGRSVWEHRFNITSFMPNPWQWNNDWEKVLHTLYSKTVYSTMGQAYSKSKWDPTKLSQYSLALKDHVCNTQRVMMEEYRIAEKGDYAMAWLLLGEGERKLHLLKKMKKACQVPPFYQDTHAFCPEITIATMLEQQGQ